MRIGIYVANVAVQPGFERLVSGHVQIPLRSAQLLREAGHEVHIVTTPILSGQVMPECLPAGVPLHHLQNASRQGASLISVAGRVDGFRPLQLIALVLNLRALARQLRLDVLHFFGGNRTANLAGAVRLLGSPCPVVMTANVGEFPERHFWLTQHLWRRIDAVITSTEYFQRELRLRGIASRVIRHGVVRNLRQEMADAGERPRRRVLFWREATPRNGGDIAVQVFDRLAPRFPQVDFDFALRPHWNQHPGVKDLPARHSNVHSFQAPYPAGVSFGALLAGSLCVLQPFRAYTIQPQLSILESLAAGIPVVASDVQSTAEIIAHGETGLIAKSEDVSAFAAAVEELLVAPARAAEMGRRALAQIPAKWSWDGYVGECQQCYAAAGA